MASADESMARADEFDKFFLHWEPQVTLKIGLMKTFESML